MDAIKVSMLADMWLCNLEFNLIEDDINNKKYSIIEAHNNDVGILQ